MILYGCAVWAVPFGISLFFFTPSGELKTDVFLFKSIMILSAGSTGAGLMLSHLGRQTSDWSRHGLIAGCAWLLINWGLDFVILLPLSGETLDVYFMRTGMRYLALPVTGWTMGAAMTRTARAAGD